MTQYLISFGVHAMDHVPDEEEAAGARRVLGEIFSVSK
jgi:hypothetical protein